jgi:hypothetical protein
MTTPTQGVRGESPGLGYPVIDSAELSPPVRRRLRKRRRELHEIPHQPPGSVLVFQLGDAYEVLPEGALRLDEPIVVDAVAVAVVTLRQMQLEVATRLPTLDGRTCIAVRVSFFCQVTDPQLVLDAGCWDAYPILTDHLNADRRLRFMAQETDPHQQWAPFQRNATARLIAYHELHPLVVPGLTVRLSDIVLQPERLAAPTRPRADRDRDSGHSTTPPAPPGPMPPAGDGRPDSVPEPDGNPAFMPDHYTWGEES